MKRLSKSGELMVKTVHLKVVLPDKVIKQTARAAVGRGYTPENVDKILEDFAEKLEKAYPLIEFRLVPVGKAAFNFICNGEKEWVKIPSLKTA
jgi:hypothetical protein